MKGERSEKKKSGWKSGEKIGGEKNGKKKKGAPGFEPGTSRSAVECSTTELYPHMPIFLVNSYVFKFIV